jgi:hypothetical protein
MDDSPAEVPAGPKVPEGINPSEVYLLDPANNDFLHGRAPVPAARLGTIPLLLRNFDMLLAMMGVVLLIVAGVWIRNPAGDYLGLFLVFLGITGALAIFRFTTNPRGDIGRLEREGRLIAGKVLDSSYERRKHNEFDPGHLFISVTYLFLAPSRRSIQRTQDQLRTDREAKLPNRGAVVLVLFLDDDHFRAL